MARKRRLFLDMDGTLAMFYKDGQCLERMYEEGFFLNLDPYENMVEAVRRIMEKYADKVEPIILSAVHPGYYAEKEKLEWVARYLGHNIQVILCPIGQLTKQEAVRFYTGSAVGKDDFLADDYSWNLLEWRSAGGSPIKFLNEINGIGTNGHNFVGPSISYNMYPEEIVKALVDIMGLEEDRR